MSLGKEMQDIWSEGLSKALEKKLEKYFAMHRDGKIPTGLYDRIMKEVEKSLLKSTMDYSRGNQLKAARILGINRNTLHKKLLALDSDENT